MFKINTEFIIVCYHKRNDGEGKRMETNISYKKLFISLFETVKQAGVVARMLQENIRNEGKRVEILQGETQAHIAMREAKTVADEIVQEMLLTSLWEYRNIISLDAEEDTALVSSFKNKDYMYSIVIDPIDGTLAYLQQKDTYSICISLLHEADAKVTLVYFPKRDRMFTYVEEEGVYVYENASMKQYDEGECCDVIRKTTLPQQVYKNHRLAQTYVKALQENGLEVFDDSESVLCCPDAIYACLKGEALAYFSKTRNVRDIMMGIILSKCKHGYACDFQGEKAQWVMQGRQDEIIFTAYEDEIKKITKNCMIH